MTIFDLIFCHQFYIISLEYRAQITLCVCEQSVSSPGQSTPVPERGAKRICGSGRVADDDAKYRPPAHFGVAKVIRRDLLRWEGLCLVGSVMVLVVRSLVL